VSLLLAVAELEAGRQHRHFAPSPAAADLHDSAPLHQRQRLLPTVAATCVCLPCWQVPGAWFRLGAACLNESFTSSLVVAWCRYIRERDLDWAWWQIDGQQGPSRTLKDMETYGLLNTTWNGPAFMPLVAHLKSLG
jgi:hypothetical protein